MPYLSLFFFSSHQDLHIKQSCEDACILIVIPFSDVFPPPPWLTAIILFRFTRIPSSHKASPCSTSSTTSDSPCATKRTLLASTPSLRCGQNCRTTGCIAGCNVLSAPSCDEPTFLRYDDKAAGVTASQCLCKREMCAMHALKGRCIGIDARFA